MANHQVLLRLYGGDDFPQLVRGDLSQHALQIGVLAHHPAVEQAQQFPVADGEHALEGQFSRYRAVRRGIGHGADLPGIIQVRHRGAPVHHHRVKLRGGHHPPAAQVVGFRLAPRRDEVQPGKVRLMGRQAQLVQGIQLHAEDVQGDDLVHGGVLGHGHHALFLRAHAGFRFQLADFPADDVAGLLQVLVFCLALGMIG